MITNIRVDMNDEQLNALARHISPSTPKRLATRKEVCEFVEGCIAAIDTITIPDQAAVDSHEVGRHSLALAGIPPGRPRLSMTSLIHRARTEDRDQLRGKSDGFVIGWCKVKYATHG